MADFDHIPSFFKIMHGDLNSEKLRIPPHFMKHMSKDLADRATLRGPSGSSWIVKRNDSEGRIFLQDGWQKFVRDHSLGNDEFLIFKYYGKMCFEVQIFEKTGLERTTRAISIEQQQTALPNQKKPRGRPKINIENNIQMEQPVQKHGSAKVLRKDESFTSKNPYFSVLIKKAAVAATGIQAIPMLFCKAHFPQHDIEVVLKNLKGESWEVNSIFATGKRSLSGGWGVHSLSVGWRAFARHNNLKIGDVCVFELVAKNEMLVHIFSDS